MTDIHHHEDRIVCDAGEWMVRAGFAGTSEPLAVFPDVVGQLRAVFGPAGRAMLYVGDEAYRMSGILSLKHPIENSCVKNFNDMERIWNHVFYGKLDVRPEENALLVTEPPLCPKSVREHVVQTMFELYRIPALFIANKSVLPLYANAMMTGTVLDSGEGGSWVVPIYEGHALPHTVQSSTISGLELTDRLITLLMMRGLPFTCKGDRKIVRRIKEDLCYVSQDFDYDIIARDTCFEEERMYELPDGQVIEIGAERFIVPEMLFKPSIVGINDAGVQDLILQAITGSDPDAQSMLASNIVISGGSTMFPGFPERLEAELSGMLPRGMAAIVVSKDRRDWLTWLGGSVLAALSTFPAMCISESEYEEYGPTIVHRRSF